MNLIHEKRFLKMSIIAKFQGLEFKEKFLKCPMCCAVLSHTVMSDSVTPWTVAHQAPLSTGFLRQEYWSGLPLPSPGDLPYPGIEPRSPALAGRFFTTEPQRRPKKENATSLKV